MPGLTNFFFRKENRQAEEVDEHYEDNGGMSGETDDRYRNVMAISAERKFTAKPAANARSQFGRNFGGIPVKRG